MAYFGIKELNVLAAKHGLELFKASSHRGSGNYFVWIHPTVEVDSVMVHSFRQLDEDRWMKELEFAVMQVENAER